MNEQQKGEKPMNFITYEITVYGSTGHLVHREYRKLESYHAAEIVGRESVRWLGGDHYEIRAIK